MLSCVLGSNKWYINLFREDFCFKVKKQMVYPNKEYINEQEKLKNRHRRESEQLFSVEAGS